MMKKLAIILAVIMLLALCACTNDPASTTDPSPTPSAPPEPSAEPSEIPSAEPSTEPNALPTEISRVVTLDGEDITDRVIELWNYANALYSDPNVDETAVRYDVITTDYVDYAPMVDFTETAHNYLTWTARQQLFSAQEIPNGYPLFVEWYDGQVYNLRRFIFDAPGRLVDITVLLNTEHTMLLSMKYLKEDYYESEYSTPTDENCECVNFEILNRDGIWLVHDYEFSVGSYEDKDAVGYDGDYWHWGEISQKHEVLTADGEDIYETVKELWFVAQHKDPETIGYKLVEELALRSEYLDYWRLEGFEEVLEKYYTDAGAEQVIDDDEFVYQDGTYYKRGYYKSGVGVSGILHVDTIEVTEDRITLQLKFELSYLDPEGCTDEVYKKFTIVKEDGVWKIDDYEYIDY